MGWGKTREMLTLADTINDVPFDRIAARLGPLLLEKKLGQYVCCEGWFIRVDGIEKFKATDVCWVFPEKKKFDGFCTWQIHMRTHDREILFSTQDLSTFGADQSMPEATESCMKTLERIIPWAFWGFDMLIDIAWRHHNSAWIRIVEKRVDAIKTGMANGSLRINADGSIQVVSSAFHMPSMKIDDRGRVAEV